MISLFKYLRSIHQISNELRDRLEDLIKERYLQSKDYLLKTGQICSNIYFVEKGMLRTYYTKDGKIISASFTEENEVCTSAESFFSQQYGCEAIRAEEDCHVYYICYTDYQNLTKDFPDFNAIARKLLEKCWVAREQRLMAMWMQSGRDKYNWLARQHPHFLQRVAARYLASYLGITEGMLSIIKKDTLRGSDGI